MQLADENRSLLRGKIGQIADKEEARCHDKVGYTYPGYSPESAFIYYINILIR